MGLNIGYTTFGTISRTWHALLPHSSITMEVYGSVATLFLYGSDRGSTTRSLRRRLNAQAPNYITSARRELVAERFGNRVSDQKVVGLIPQPCNIMLCPWARHLTLLASGKCPCTYFKPLWIRASAKLQHSYPGYFGFIFVKWEEAELLPLDRVDMLVASLSIGMGERCLVNFWWFLPDCAGPKSQTIGALEMNSFIKQPFQLAEWGVVVVSDFRLPFVI